MMGRGKAQRAGSSTVTWGTVACAAALLAVGCGESHGPRDAAIVFDLDGARVDGGFDAGPPTGIGEPCTADTECSGMADTCLIDPADYPGGTCSAGCTLADPSSCPAGSTCVAVTRTLAFCLPTCEGEAQLECRAGYGCADPGGGASEPYCVGGCSDDTDCPEGSRCDPGGGDRGQGSCYDPDAHFGDACVNSATCPMAAYCFAEEFSGWPAGTCVGIGCDVANDTGCGERAHCVPSPGVGAVCLGACEADGDCRTGYRCRPPSDHPERGICRAGCTEDAQCSDGRVCNTILGTCAEPFVDGQLGQACRQGSGCVGGSCWREFDTGFPGAYCAYEGCMVGDDASCPAGGVCVATPNGTNACLDACASDEDCTRAGYRCLPSDLAVPGSATACLPACTADDQCANDEFRCNPGTGLCRPVLDPAQVGEPCTAGGDSCGGGRCLSEAEGWPAGTCALPGCRLSGEGPQQTCPAASVCVDDASGDPTIGHCIDACTVGEAGCRPGYQCVALAEGETAGACRPIPAEPPPTK